jgi:hypothetical protein
LGEFSRSPRQESSSVSGSPEAGSTSAIAAGSCSHTTSRPSGASAMPLATFASARTSEISPESSASRLMSTRGRSPGSGSVVK